MRVSGFHGTRKRGFTVKDELKRYALSWIKPSFVKNEQAIEQQHLADTGKITPRSAQVEALYELKKVSLSNIGEQFMSFYQDHPLHQKDLRD